MHWFRRAKSHRINVHFLFLMSFDCAMILFSFNIAFIFSSMMLQNICLNNLKEILNNLRKRISISVFSIYLIISTEFNYSLIIYINFLNFFVILTTSTELNLINFCLFIFDSSCIWINVDENLFHCNVCTKNNNKFRIFVKNNFIRQIHYIRIIFVANIFHREQNNFLLLSIL